MSFIIKTEFSIAQLVSYVLNEIFQGGGGFHFRRNLFTSMHDRRVITVKRVTNRGKGETDQLS